MPLPAGTRLGRYEVRAQIGAGGMGVVYKAFDPLLKRPVALKVLPAELIQNSERVRRFRQEAEAASALNHPAIITIYEIGEGEPGIARPPGGASGAAVSNAVPAVTPAINYIAMEFIEGATLRDAIHHESADLLKLLGYVTQVVGGLAKAHDKGIIHRDLKPNNIMVTLDGFAKILDFGLAKLVERANQPGPGEGPMSEAATAALPPPSLSKKGMLIGTIGYMSPEQAQGKVDEVDERSDVFACGCILYECVTGRLPFRGASELDTLHKIVYEPPPPDELAPHAPPELRRIIDKCLSKGADLRYQTARELALDLKQVCHELESRPDLGRTRLLARSLSAPDRPPSDQGLWKTPRRRAARAETAGRDAAPPSPRSHSRKAVNTLAVLPLLNVSTDPDYEYLSSGITESIINNMSRVPNLRVMARSTAFRYAGREVDPQVVGQELNVRAVLVGRLLSRGDHLITNVELVDVNDGSQLWGEHYNVKFDNIFAVEEQIACSISEALKLKLSVREKRRLGKRYTDNALAYQLYLKGRHHWNKRSEEDIRKGIEYFQLAVAEDPCYALAYAGLADSYIVLMEYGDIPFREAHLQARKAATKAVEIDDTLAEAHTSIAGLGYDEWGLLGAESEFKRAIELNPNYTTARYWYAEYLSFFGRHDEAIVQSRTALACDPLSAVGNTLVGEILYRARRYDEAIVQFHKAIQLERDFHRTHRSLGKACLAVGRYKEAIETFERADVLAGKDAGQAARRAASLKEAHASRGERGFWRKSCELLKQDRERGDGVSPYALATSYAHLGDDDSAIEWLRRAYEERERLLLQLGTEPCFDHLLGDSRVVELLRLTGLSS